MKLVTSKFLSLVICFYFITCSCFPFYLSETFNPYSSNAPLKRNFISLPEPFQLSNQLIPPPIQFRVLQFNALADGLSGLARDKGFFSRVNAMDLDWEVRKTRLIGEILQYTPDIITMQEIDHYNDFFLPELNSLGYIGVFAPKPLSACLVVSNNSDGCAIFLNEKKFRVMSTESITLALTKAEMKDGGEVNEEDIYIRAQNSVALIVLCEVILNDRQRSSSIQLQDNPVLLIANTHLKSSKSAIGEKYRQKEILQVIQRVDRITTEMKKIGKPPAVILAGSFNSVPETTTYAPLTYRAIKSHPLGFRSVYNEDLPTSKISGEELYTTWKIRQKGNNKTEIITKRYSDYIFYSPYKKFVLPTGLTVPIAKVPQEALIAGRIISNAGTVVPKLSSMSTSLFFRSTVYLFTSTICAACLFESHLVLNEKIIVISLALLGIVIFEKILDTVVMEEKEENISYETAVLPLSRLGLKLKEIVRTSSPKNKYNSGVSSSGDDLLYIRNAIPILQPVGVLNLYSPDEIGNDGLIASSYPSDHLSISASFQLNWELLEPVNGAPRSFAVNTAGDVFCFDSNRWVPWRPPTLSTKDEN